MGSLSLKDSSSEYRAALDVASSFAESHLGGAGDDEYVSGLTLLNSHEATAIIGDSDNEHNNKDSFTAVLQKRAGKWKLVWVKYKFEPTNQIKIDTFDPPYPDPYWDTVLATTG